MVNRTLFASRHAVAVYPAQYGIIAAGRGPSLQHEFVDFNRNQTNGGAGAHAGGTSA
jgi:hypothetical protein